MRIGFFVPRCAPDNSHGRYVIELAKRLAPLHDVTVYAGTFSASLPAGLACRSLPVPNRPALLRLAALWAASTVAVRRQDFDILHVQGADSPVGDIVTAHCCNRAMRDAAADAPTLFRKVNYAAGVAAERYCLRKPSTRAVVAVSRKVEEEIRRHYGVAADKIAVIPPGVDIDWFHPRQGARSREAVRERYRLASDDFVIAFVGGDYRLKGLGTLLRAAGLVDGRVRVMALGVKADPALRRLVAGDGVGSSAVVLIHKVSDIAAYYAAADCFALPTRYDTFSLATLEAMASGLPVIVSGAAGVTEHLRNGVDALVLDRPDDVTGLAGHLRRLAGDATLRGKLAVAGRETAKRFSWDRVADQTLSVYRQVVGAGR